MPICFASCGSVLRALHEIGVFDRLSSSFRSEYPKVVDSGSCGVYEFDIEYRSE